MTKGDVKGLVSWQIKQQHTERYIAQRAVVALIKLNLQLFDERSDVAFSYQE